MRIKFESVIEGLLLPLPPPLFLHFPLSQMDKVLFTGKTLNSSNILSNWKKIFATTFLTQRKKSDRGTVYLKRVSLHSSGNYKCEVSAEAPSFKTKSANQDMVVVVTPSHAEIVGAKAKYRVGDIVNVTCNSFR